MATWRDDETMVWIFIENAAAVQQNKRYTTYSLHVYVRQEERKGLPTKAMSTPTSRHIMNDGTPEDRD